MSRATSVQFVKLASNIASYYGFRSLGELQPLRRSPSFEDAVAACVNCLSTKPLEPILVFYATPMASYLPAGLLPRDTAEFGLQIVGSEESIGEVLMLKTLFSIVEEWGSHITKVRINALGDRDSRERFKRELTAYLRRHFETLDETERVKITHDPLSAYSSQSDSVQALLEDAPRSMHFLSEKSRVHFRDVLEHLEEVGIPYELDDSLIGDERSPRIVFRFDLAEEDGMLLGNMGGRFDEFASRMSGRTGAASVNSSIFFRKKSADRVSFAHSRNARPKVYFIQLGLRAKLQGFTVIDTLRQARIPVYQAFDTSKLAPQLDAARTAGVSHVLIMGQREALDGTIIVRSLNNSSQTIVELGRLPKILRTLNV